MAEGRVDLVVVSLRIGSWGRPWDLVIRTVNNKPSSSKMSHRAGEGRN